MKNVLNCEVSHVINYDLPHNIDSYVHRIGVRPRGLAAFEMRKEKGVGQGMDLKCFQMFS